MRAAASVLIVVGTPVGIVAAIEADGRLSPLEVVAAVLTWLAAVGLLALLGPPQGAP